MRGKLYIRIAIITVVAGAVLGYAYSRTHDIIAGPQISIETPVGGATVGESLANVRGVVKNAVEITLNDRLIFANEAGEISEALLLSYGYNVIEVTATDKLGRRKVHLIELVYK